MYESFWRAAPGKNYHYMDGANTVKGIYILPELPEITCEETGFDLMLYSVKLYL